MELITKRDEYFKQKAIKQQSQVVNFRCSSNRTSEALVWTYRTTNCDVISVITTSLLLKDGKMKDIHIQPSEVKRLKPPSVKATNRDLLGSSPYDFGLSVDIVKKTKKVNKLLHEEKNEFMSKLSITRFVRSKLENDASVKIQAAYRGYFTRKTFSESQHYASINSMIRANLRSYLDNSDYLTVNLGRYTKERQLLRSYAITLIQCIFRKYLGRKCLRRRIFENHLRVQTQAAVVIQARCRGISARGRVRSLIEKRRIILYRLSVVKIQCILRGMFARRRVHRRRYRLYYLASRMIQSWYRAKYSRRMANHIKHMLYLRTTNIGAQLMQNVVRRFLAVRRLNRIRLRNFHRIINSWVTLIQRIIRKFVARRRVDKIRQAKQALAAAQHRQQEQAALSALALEEETESIALLESADIFAQVEHGNTVGVEDIFKGLMGGEHSAADTNAEGDNLLTIAARLGNADLMRKCILWGFDINHRNHAQQSAIMIAAVCNQSAAFHYLLSFHSAVASEDDGSKQSLVLSDEDKGFLLVTATANAALEGLGMLQALLLQGFDANCACNTGMTAMHAACEIGHIEAFKLLVKYKARLEGEDELGQTPLHKACCVSLQLVQWILGMDPEFNTYMSEQTRLSAIQAVDADGKDSLLLAALSGQSEVLELLDGVLQSSLANTAVKASIKLPSRPGSAGEEISWSTQDISKAVQLVVHGNVFCLHRVLDTGFEVDWHEANTGLTMALASCKRGDLDIINLLLEKGADFSHADELGRNCMHWVAMAEEQASSLVVHLLMHPAAAACKITKSLLQAIENEGNTAFHFAASKGTDLNIDLLAADIIPPVLNTRNKQGMTPLLIACSRYYDHLIHSYLRLGADALLVDGQEHGCIWHLFHPCDEVLVARRVVCSEFLTSSTNSNSTQSRKDKGDDSVRLATDIAMVTALLKAGCSLYTDYGRGADDMRKLPFKAFMPPTSAQDPTAEPGDVAIQEQSISLLKSIVPAIVSPLDAWRLFISSIRFDDGSLRMMQHLLRLGILDLIAPEHDNADEQSIITMATAFSKPSDPVIQVHGSSKRNKPSIAPALGSRVASATAIDTYQVSRLHDVFFLEKNAVAWIICLQNSKALQHFIKKGYDVTVPVDSVGNSSLHFIAAHGTVEMVDMVLADKKVRLESQNPAGQTAGMVAAMVGNFKVAKRLFELKASPRKSLEGCYAGWVLAFVRKHEKNEVNTQTGRYGDDDELYFSTKPDPFYSTWYMG